MLLDLFEDLEQQAEGLHLLERDAEVAERGRAEYAHVDLASRLHASVGLRVSLCVAGLGALEGDLVRVGADWCLLEVAEDREWVVPMAAVQRARGLSPRSVSEAVRPVVTRLGLGSVLRGIAGSRAPAVTHLRDGSLLRGRLGRVGADFVEVHVAEGSARGQGGTPAADLVPFAHVAAVRPL